MARIVVIGAGLAGLRAAGLVAASGRDVLVLEASGAVGGRVATDVVDGFRCDRGFQLLNPLYPAARRALDMGRLDLHRFGRGAALRTDDGLQVLADPTRHPQHAAGLVRGPLTPGDLAAVARWVKASGQESLTLSGALDAAGFSPVVRRVVERFFSGVTLDPEGATSASQVRRLAGFFALATPAVPAQGMAAVPLQVAEPIRDRIRLGARVSAVRPGAGGVEVRLADGSVERAETVVLAAGPLGNAALLGLPAPAMLGVTTWWFAADEAPTRSPFLHLDLREGARLANACVQSNVAPSYAPAGQHLVQASAVGDHALTDADAAREAGSVLGADASRWRLLVRHDITHALPALPPGARALMPVPAGVLVADDLPGASIQDALASGERAARAVIG
ncbi:NAD(P)/FAD-dependent oxidoreductase [Tessaracoccus sp. Y1736]